MTRGRHHNTAHLVADTLHDARTQWVDTFTRDRADLGPTHATARALDDINRYGPQPPPPRRPTPATPQPRRPAGDTSWHPTPPDHTPSIGR